MRGEIFVADQPAVLLAPGGQFAGERPAIEIVARQTQAATAIAAPCGFRGDQSTQRMHQERMPWKPSAIGRRKVGSATAASRNLP